MIEGSVIYTDGHRVKVTPYQFIVGKVEYLLEGIIKIRFLTIRGNKWPGIFLAVVGVIGFVCGWLGLFYREAVYAGDTLLNLNQIAIYAGGALFLIGLIWLIIVRDKYTVRITTAEGDKDAVVSRKKDYIQQIVNALYQATGAYH